MATPLPRKKKIFGRKQSGVPTERKLRKIYLEGIFYRDDEEGIRIGDALQFLPEKDHDKFDRNNISVRGDGVFVQKRLDAQRSQWRFVPLTISEEENMKDSDGEYLFWKEGEGFKSTKTYRCHIFYTLICRKIETGWGFGTPVGQYMSLRLYFHQKQIEATYLKIVGKVPANEISGGGLQIEHLDGDCQNHYGYNFALISPKKNAENTSNCVCVTTQRPG